MLSDTQIIPNRENLQPISRSGSNASIKIGFSGL